MTLVRQITVGYAFLKLCAGLTTVDLSPLSQVTVIKGCFMMGCTALSAIDLSPLSGVTIVEFCFLTDCVKLTAVDLSATLATG